MIISSLVEGPGEWKKANVSAVFRKHRKEHPEICRPVSLTLIPEKVVMGQIILEAVNRRKREKKYDLEYSAKIHSGEAMFDQPDNVL